MNNQNQNNGFLDTRTLLVGILVVGFFIGWQSYLKNKYGTQPTSAPVAATENTKQNDANVQAGAPTAASPGNSQAQSAVATAANVEEKVLSYQNKDISFDVSSKGMGLKKLTLKNHTDREHNQMKLGESETSSLYQLAILGRKEPLDFEINQKSENEFEGTAHFGNVIVSRSIKINPETEALENSVHVENTDAQFPGLVVRIPEKAVEGSAGSLFSPALNHQEFVVIHSGTEERVNSSAAKEAVEKTFPAVGLLGIGNQYFTSTMVDKSEIIPDARVTGGKGAEEILAEMNYKPAGGKNSMDLKWIAYSGGKSYSNLEKIDKDMAKVVDLGFFSSIGRILLMILKWLYSQVGNWGVSIILLTLFVRILVLPLNVTTFKSTKKMQKLQPLIASLRERYKDDPQALNRETMNLWKEHKVNPLGGCLPMLLQLPIFFALYRVLGQSIELYQAPFFGWIHDLSLKDPFYVLPVLMAVCMYFQQKMTPTTMDPSQAKIMQFLPLVFALMMINLPSGLTLYIFINTLSGIILQRMFMRDRSTAVTTKKVKA